VEQPTYGYDYGGYAYPPSYGRERNPAIGTVGGAILGAVIGNQVADRHHRAAATAAGAVIGGVIGSNF
jgi:outer membrane lipoprotein SlyB